MDRIASTPERLARLTGDACVAVPDAATILSVRGPGADQCLQGLLTNDLLKPGVDSLVYGALLTPKGMIVADYWCLRGPDGYLLVADPPAREPSLERFGKSLPPRLAKVSDETGALTVVWLLGAASTTVLGSVVGALPGPGRTASASFGSHAVTIGTPHSARAPFRHLAVVPAQGLEAFTAALAGAGAVAGDRTDLRAARVLSGFPTLGAEIDDRTMPAEVDFDELGGVSHQKGCYVGQETVARLHFRGHANWLLRGIRVDPSANDVPAAIDQDGKTVIRIGTLLVSGAGPALGLAKVRRELEPGAQVDVPGGRLTVVAVPLEG